MLEENSSWDWEYVFQDAVWPKVGDFTNYLTSALLGKELEISFSEPWKEITEIYEDVDPDLAEDLEEILKDTYQIDESNDTKIDWSREIEFCSTRRSRNESSAHSLVI